MTIHCSVAALRTSWTGQGPREGHNSRNAAVLGVGSPLRLPFAAMLAFKQLRNAVITIAGIEPTYRIRKGQFGLRRLGVPGGDAPAIWNAILGACR
jgi:hypothetical protein